MAKTNNSDIDELNFSFGGTVKKAAPKVIQKTTPKAAPVTTVAEAPAEVEVPVVAADTPAQPVETLLDKQKKQPVPIPEGSSDANDTRYTINTVDDIVNHTMWNTMGNGVYSNVYQGMQAYVKSTKDIMVYVGPTTINGVLVADATNLNYWVTLKNTQNMDKMITSVTINDRYVSVMDATGTRLNIDMAGTKVPYKDGYVSLIDAPRIAEMIYGDSSRGGELINQKFPDVTTVINNIYDRLTLEGNDL